MLVFAAAILTCGIAAADTIVANSVALGGSIWIGVYEGTTLTDTQEQAGVISITVTDNTGSYDRQTLCVDLFTNINTNTTYNTGVYLPSAFGPPSKVATLERIAYLLDNYWPTTATQAEGLQLAIWDIEVDGGDGFYNGQVRQADTNHPTDSNVLSDAVGFETNSAGHASNLADVYVSATQATPPVAAQMLEGPVYGTGPPPVAPESSTLVLAGVALLALGHAARRKLGSRAW